MEREARYISVASKHGEEIQSNSKASEHVPACQAGDRQSFETWLRMPMWCRSLEACWSMSCRGQHSSSTAAAQRQHSASTPPAQHQHSTSTAPAQRQHSASTATEKTKNGTWFCLKSTWNLLKKKQPIILQNRPQMAPKSSQNRSQLPSRGPPGTLPAKILNFDSLFAPFFAPWGPKLGPKLTRKP